MKKNSEERNVAVAEHILVSKHEILTPKEIKKVLKRYNTKLDQFPYILGTDPVVKEIGAKLGDLIKITRKSETAGKNIYYRYVVEG
ncbi:MAG: DNA-directed RNA polymerase subunit H [Candidatus Methylarchaceae archaeon HK02M2]|nr:DNA-directed RNA polymerase subunit H [Candidatus Methylarchaceae archaeon HK02M2]